ncbi:MAG: glycosyltransferase, partial [Prevotella sp.]|nr:glycosyltransferase [Prevotella sp.]
MPKVSVIVAIYNVDLFLERCLNSLANQTLQDIEIILVDDGSTDLSGKICEQFAKQDSRFLVFHKRNEGVSCTREFGVKKATGEYLI